MTSRAVSMKPVALLGFCLILPVLPGQEFAPNSVVDMIFTARPPASGYNFFAAILSGEGVFTPLNLSWDSSVPIRVPGTYAWTKTGLNAGTLAFFGPESDSRYELVFTSNGRGTYRESTGPTGAVSAGSFLIAAMPNGPPPPLCNLSTRATLSSGRQATLGFVIEGQTSRRVLVRAIGPSLARFGVANAVATPVLTVHRGAIEIGANAGWGGAPSLAAAFDAAGAFALDKTSRDCAVVLTLEPGNYTAQVRAETAGEVLLEVYFSY